MIFLTTVLFFGITFIYSANFQNEGDLINAAAHGNIEDVRNLVEVVGVPANIQNGNALIAAARIGHLDIVRFLAEEGPEDTRVPANIQQGSALITAAENGHLDIVRFLVGEGPEETRVPANIQQGLALITAARNGHLEVVRFLLESYFFDFDGDQYNRALFECKRSPFTDEGIKIEINTLIEAFKAVIEFSPK